jgi:hypothetical protein
MTKHALQRLFALRPRNTTENPLSNDPSQGVPYANCLLSNSAAVKYANSRDSPYIKMCFTQIFVSVPYDE